MFCAKVESAIGGQYGKKTANGDLNDTLHSLWHFNTSMWAFSQTEW